MKIVPSELVKETGEIPERRAEVLATVVEDVRQKGLTSGDVGYRYLLRALADGGRSDVVFTMNHQSEKPGYGMQLAKGATSLTEAWDAAMISAVARCFSPRPGE